MVALSAPAHIWQLEPADLNVAAGTAAVTAESSCPRLTPKRLRHPPRFYPQRLVGAWVPIEARECVYLIAAGSARPSPIFRAPDSARVRGPVWAPDGRSIAVAYRSESGFRVALLDLHGRVIRSVVGRDVAFFRSGELVVGRSDHLLTVDSRRRTRILTRRGDLSRAAGFHVTTFQLHTIAGHGRAGVAVLVWGDRMSSILLLRRNGALTQMTPVLGNETSFPGPPAWSPDGNVLLIPWQRPDPTGRADHAHCLAGWRHVRGYWVGFCRNPHFDRVRWHPDGGTALLNDGRIVARDATVRARVSRIGRGWSVRWADEISS